MQLLFAPEPFRDESLPGYLLRLAQVHFLPTVQQLLRPAGLRAKAQYSEEEVQRFAACYGMDVEPLLVMARYAAVQGSLGKGAFLRRVAHVCPQCLVQAPYLRQVWQHELVTACPTHARVLIGSCPACETPFRHDQGTIIQCRCGYDLRECVAPDADGANQAIAVLLAGEPDAVDQLRDQLGGLDALPRDIDAFLLFLANLTQPSPWRRGSPIPVWQAEAFNRAAYGLVEDLQRQFRDFVLQRIEWANQQKSSRFIANLGGWYRQLTREFNRPEYAVLMQIAAQGLVNHAVAPINRKLKQISSDLLGMKAVYTTAEAARLLGSSSDRITSHVKAGRLRGQVIQGGAVEYCLVERAEVEAQLQAATGVLTAKEVQHQLNISRRTRERLVESGVLRRLPESERPLFAKGHFGRRDVEQLYAQLAEECPVQDAKAALSLEEINARRFPRDGVTELYRQLASGRLRPVARVRGVEGLAALRFDQREVLAVVQPQHVPFELSITDLTRITRWKHSTIKGWIAAGRLPCRREFERGKERLWISPAHLIEFLSRNIVLADVAEQLNTKSAWLYPPLMSQGVTAQPGHSASAGIQRGLLISTAAVVNVASQRSVGWRRSAEMTLSETSHEDTYFVNAERVAGGRDDQAY